jgi:hypothetical protein
MRPLFVASLFVASLWKQWSHDSGSDDTLIHDQLTNCIGEQVDVSVNSDES